MDQPHLFPLTDLKTEGYAEPEPVVEEADADALPDTVEDAA